MGKVEKMTPDEFKLFLLTQGLTILDFAELIGVKFATVDHWCHGRRSISVTIVRLCKLFERRPELMREFGK